MYKLITNVRAIGGTLFNYAVMDVKTGKCYGFETLNGSFESNIKYYVYCLTKGKCWIPVSYVESFTEFSTLSDLKQTNPELFI